MKNQISEPSGFSNDKTEKTDVLKLDPSELLQFRSYRLN